MVKKTPDLPVFLPKLYVMHDHMHRKIILKEVEDGEVTIVAPDVARDLVMNFIHSTRFALGTDKLTAKHMNEIVTEFCAIAPPIPEPAMVLQKNEPGLTYRRLPFDIEPDPTMERCPLFCEMMNRTSNNEALVQWIGSLFDPDADMQQYVWLYGEGQNGKSTLGRVLHRILGPGARYTDPPKKSHDFWLYDLIGKRLVVYGDCDDERFVTHGTFKSMTGGDPVRANVKFAPALQVVMKAKHLFFSNKKPGISSSMADQRRIILCEMMPIEGAADPTYEHRLWLEAPYILGECRRLYQENCGPGRRIACDQSAAKELAMENDVRFETIFSCRFSKIEGARLAGNVVQRILREEGIKDGREINKFKDFIRVNHGVTCGYNTKKCMEYVGMSIGM